MSGLEDLPALLAAGDWAAAERLLKRAAKARGAGAPVFYNLGKVCFEMGKLAQAATWLRKALAADPGHVNAWFELGRVAVAREDYETARKSFGRALALDPGDADTRRNLGRVALRLGQYAMAREVWAPLAGDGEADAALYRAAAELRSGDAGQLRRALMARPGHRGAALQALVRVSKGCVPLKLR